MHDIIGAIYPIPRYLKDRFFDGKTKVFVKFLARKSTRLAPKDKIIFYVSRGSKKLVGEGVIQKVEFLTPQDVMAKYRQLLFLNEDEFYAYVKRSPMRTESKEMLTLVLKDLREYTAPIQYDRPMTMTGQYLTAAEYNSLISRKVH